MELTRREFFNGIIAGAAVSCLPFDVFAEPSFGKLLNISFLNGNKPSVVVDDFRAVFFGKANSGLDDYQLAPETSWDDDEYKLVIIDSEEKEMWNTGPDEERNSRFGIDIITFENVQIKFNGFCRFGGYVRYDTFEESPSWPGDGEIHRWSKRSRELHDMIEKDMEYAAGSSIRHAIRMKERGWIDAGKYYGTIEIL